jgi:hypothetical protein
MPDIDNRGRLDALKRELEKHARSSIDPRLSDPIQSMLTALDYADHTLVESSLHSLLTSLAEVAKDFIVKELDLAAATKEGIAKAWKEFVDGHACDDFDDPRNVIESFIDNRISSMSQIRDRLVMPLKKWKCDVQNAQDLERGIRDLRRFRNDLLRDWPSNNRSVKFDKNEIAEARAALASGSKGLKKEQMKWGYDPSNNGS